MESFSSHVCAFPYNKTLFVVHIVYILEVEQCKLNTRFYCLLPASSRKSSASNVADVVASLLRYFVLRKLWLLPSTPTRNWVRQTLLPTVLLFFSVFLQKKSQGKWDLNQQGFILCCAEGKVVEMRSEVTPGKRLLSIWRNQDFFLLSIRWNQCWFTAAQCSKTWWYDKYLLFSYFLVKSGKVIACWISCVPLEKNEIMK